MSKTEMPSIRFYGFDNDWEQRKLGGMASLITKGTTPLDKSNTGVVNFVKIESIDEASGKITITQKISLDEHNGYLHRSQLKENDILFSIAGTLGRVTSVKSSILPANTNQALAIIRLKDGCLDYVKTYLKGKAVADFIKKNPTIGAQPNLSLEQVANLEIAIPSEDEQKIIGAFFQKLDNLITLHQRKFEKLTNVKKSMLEKMFPRNGSCYPEIRFKGFTDPWEQRKFGEVFMSLQNNTLSRAELNDEIGAAQNIHYGDVLIKYDEILDVSKEPLSYIEKQSIADKFKTSYLQNGDVIIADTAEDETVGKCTEIEGLTDQKVISGLHTMPVRPNRKFAFGFLGFYLNSAAYHDQLKPLMQGIKVTSISKGAMQDTVVKFPLDLKEQEQIGIYFGGLDHLITLHQRELEKLQSIKKALLEKMFV